MTDKQKKMVEELGEIEQYLLIETSDDPAEVRERIARMNVYLARANKIWAEAKYILAKEREYLYDEAIDTGTLSNLKPSIVKDIVNAKTADSEYVTILAERVSRTIVHQCDGLRSLLSWNKEDMKLTRTGY